MNKFLQIAVVLTMVMSGCVPAEEPVQVVDRGQVQVLPADYQYPDTPTFSLLSWNVEHFLDPYDDPYIDNQRENNPPENMQLRRALLIEALRKADADVVLLQEFESAKYLKQLADDSLSGMGYTFFADIPSHGWYMNVVLMSRFPLGEISGYGNVTTPLPDYLDEEGKKETQSHINTRMWTIEVFPAAAYHFLLTGVHLKAGRGPRNIAMRKGQINYLVSQWNEALAANPSANMIMAGDLNATPDSEELSLLQTNKQLIAPFTDPIDTAVYSHPADEPRRRLDYLLVNENMLPEMQPESVQVTHFFSADTMRMISDHLPVMGVFQRKDL
ncbi:endonuclease/exonuclease/phosphatase family protein [Marinoscillum furvescens]|uniref:Endonuclease/exonuclease/phosphatase family metal-dependent hydrolase n=1 Tax=Marinoscillum furvescens DSM 4134 TaxID=1122208 RepID=A0A3D9KX52_MARFU|nr:endonuclease/exonuclease/phosphatase family protein [Marinoscillum furvescens]RED93217.1 endonuclease/exonuclease/phosphatase family metal-dependent hydrolase [Marinoscillum furvescens DSM 4134]